MDVSTFGDLLTALRKQRRVSQNDLADKLDMHRNTISNWERGICLPDSKTLVLELAKQLRLNKQEIQQLLEASLTAVSSYWLMPYQRNPFFTGRESVLEQLHGVLACECTAVLSQSYALSGLGGIGKTQTAIEYAYRYTNEYAAVFWISAETNESIVSSFVSIADLLNLPEKQEKEQSRIIAAVTRWLTGHSDWLVVFDNMEDLELVKSVLPPAHCGSLLFTSRRQAPGFAAQTLDMEQMTPEEGIRFLLHRARLLDPTASLYSLTPEDIALAREIVAVMDGLPLALDQAGAYIEETKCGLELYLQIYYQQRLKVLGRRGDGDLNHPASVVTTLSLSFQYVEQRSPIAVGVLKLCAFLAPDAIPEEIFEEIFIEGAEKLGPTLAPVTSDACLLDEAIENLLIYSLLARDPHVHTLSVHRLVQAVLRDSMPAEIQRQWMQHAVHAVEAVLPESSERANWPAFERLLPHALICATWVEQASFATMEAFHLVRQTGLYLDARASYRDAEPLLWRALALCEQRLGVDHLDTAVYRNDLAMNVVNQGKYAEAEPLLVSALVLSEQKLGAMHPDTIQRRKTLAELYRVQGKFDEAEPLLENICALRGYQVEGDIPHVVTSLTMLALLYWDQLKLDKVEPLLVRALALYEHLPPETDHLVRAIILTNLAMLFLNMGEDAKAETLFQRTAAIVEQQFATNHLFTVMSLNNLAELYSVQGKYGQAETVYQQTLALCEQQSGVDHPYTALCLNNLAGFFMRQRKFVEAEPLYRQALTIREQRLWATHPDVAQSLNNLAVIFLNQGKYGEAEPLLKRVGDILEQQYGKQHFYTTLSLQNLAELYRVQGKFAGAEPLYQRAIALCERQLGSEHPFTFLCCDAFARFSESRRKFAEGEPLALSQQILIIREQQWGPIIETRIRALTTWLCFI